MQAGLILAPLATCIAKPAIFFRPGPLAISLPPSPLPSPPSSPGAIDRWPDFSSRPRVTSTRIATPEIFPAAPENFASISFFVARRRVGRDRVVATDGIESHPCGEGRKRRQGRGRRDASHPRVLASPLA